MDITALDPRLAERELRESDIVWRTPETPPFSLRGVFFDEKEGLYVRMPLLVAAEANPSVRVLARMTAGGRLRFRTASPYIALRALVPNFSPMGHMPLTGSHGFAFFVDGRYDGKVAPSPKEALDPKDGRIAFAGSYRHHAGEGMHDVEIYLPLYGGVAAFEIGLAESAELLPPRPYTHEKPIVAYGSSITQGACASRGGNDALSHLSRMLDSDILNLGFSGNGNAEPAMLDYLCSLENVGAYIFDYNYYTDAPDRILPPHSEIYRRLRAAHPDVPILMIDKPGCDYDPEGYAIRCKMIEETYRTAVAEGDTRVAMLDAYELFGDEYRDACLVDTNHPNDLGFLRMAEAMAKALSPFLSRT